jgi:hypothetical protein
MREREERGEVKSSVEFLTGFSFYLKRGRMVFL